MCDVPFFFVGPYLDIVFTILHTLEWRIVELCLVLVYDVILDR